MKFECCAALLALLLFAGPASSQNLIINPGGESPASSGWTIVSKGSDCYTSTDWHIKGDQNGFPIAHGGEYYFFSGCTNAGEIYQDIDVTSLAGDIDAANLNFTFSGFVQVFNQSPSDGALMKVEYFNASNVLVGFYSTGITKNLGVWTQYTSTITAMPGTRRVRVTLKSYLYKGPSVDAYFDDLSLTSEQLLPLKLISFNTLLNRLNEVEATWKTANEFNNDHFELQRSKDGSVWETIATVKGAGTSPAVHSYAAKDKFPLSGLSYYRLVQFDLDGKLSVSKINPIKSGNVNFKLLAYPNPAENIVTLEGEQQSLKNIAIFSPQGRNLTSSVRIMHESPTLLKLNIEGLPAGLYYIRAKNQAVPLFKKY